MAFETLMVQTRVHVHEQRQVPQTSNDEIM